VPDYQQQMPDPNSVFGMNPQVQMPSFKKVRGWNLWDKIQEGVAPYPKHLEGLVNENDVKGARNQGLLSLGASLLQSSGPSLQPIGLGQAIGRGIEQGMGTYQGAVDQMGQRALGRQSLDMNRMKMEGMKGDMARIQQLDAGRKQLLQKLGPMPTEPVAREEYLTKYMNELISMGDEEGARTVSQALLASGNHDRKAPGTYVTVPGPDGKPMRRWVSQEEAAKGVPEYEAPTRDAGSKLLDEQRMFTRANMLGDDYRSTTGSIQKAADQYRTLTAAADGARNGIPAAQIALVFSFMKTLDPTSVVRESEYATAENARGVPETVRNLWNKVKDGDRLTPGQVDDMVNEASAAARQWKRQQDLHMKTFDARAKRWKIDPQDVTMDFFDGLNLDAAGGAQAPISTQPGVVQPGAIPPRFNMDQAFPWRQ
jgi:hypothetical protein